MSSSPSRAAIPPAAVAGVPGQPPPEVSPFPYNQAAAKPGVHNFPLSGFAGPDAVFSPASGPGVAEREAQAREAGRLQGESQAQAKFAGELGRERAAVARAVAEFARERSAYYQKIEEEAVRLALAIARKILHREAQVDPLLLMGIVRVALGKIKGATEVTLLVHPQKAAEWRQYLASRMRAGEEPGEAPELVEDAAMAPEQCVLRTSMGTVELGLEVQLKEIEAGLTDLLAARPEAKG